MRSIFFLENQTQYYFLCVSADGFPHFVKVVYCYAMQEKNPMKLFMILKMLRY
jgi:hypothetical protein